MVPNISKCWCESARSSGVGSVVQSHLLVVATRGASYRLRNLSEQWGGCTHGYCNIHLKKAVPSDCSKSFLTSIGKHQSIGRLVFFFFLDQPSDKYQVPAV